MVHSASPAPCAYLPSSDTALAATLHIFLVFLLPLFIRWACMAWPGLRPGAAGAAAAGAGAGCAVDDVSVAQHWSLLTPAARRYLCEYRAKAAFIWPYLSAQQRAQYPCQLLSAAGPLVQRALQAAVLFYLLGVACVLGLLYARATA